MKDLAIGLGVVGVFALCCGAPTMISVLASGAVLGTIGAVWSTGRVVLLSSAAALMVLGMALVARRIGSRAIGPTDCCALPMAADGDERIATTSAQSEPEPEAVASNRGPD